MLAQICRGQLHIHGFGTENFVPFA